MVEKNQTVLKNYLFKRKKLWGCLILFKQNTFKHSCFLALLFDLYTKKLWFLKKTGKNSISPMKIWEKCAECVGCWVLAADVPKKNFIAFSNEFLAKVQKIFQHVSQILSRPRQKVKRTPSTHTQTLHTLNKVLPKIPSWLWLGL